MKPAKQVAPERRKYADKGVADQQKHLKTGWCRDKAQATRTMLRVEKEPEGRMEMVVKRLARTGFREGMKRYEMRAEGGIMFVVESETGLRV